MNIANIWNIIKVMGCQSMKMSQTWTKRLMHNTPKAVIVLSALSLSMNLANSVSSFLGYAFALAFAGLIFAAIIVNPLWLKYVMAAAAYIAFFNTLPELSFDKLISVIYLSLVLLAFLLPSPIPVIITTCYYLYFIPTYSSVVEGEMIRTIVIGVIINMILYSLLAFYFRNLKKENEINRKLNGQLNEAFGKLEHMAYYDTLTKLPNRELLKKRMVEQLFSDSKVAVLFLDLDHFKNVNDMMGHNAGDQMLQHVAAHLTEEVGHCCFIARYAGDEFVLLFPYQVQEEIGELAKHLIHSFHMPFQIEQKHIYTTPSIGISLYPGDSRDVDTLIQYADKAMYDVKRGEKNGFCFFSAIENEELLLQIKLENDLRSALSKEEFVIHYQPLVEMSTGEIRGFEALVRWTHPELGQIMPGAFIPLAEQTGVIVELGEWVLEEACKQVRSWQRAGNPNLTLAVNISIRQFKSSCFESTVLRILKKTGFDPSLLELEVTESMMQNLSEMSLILGELKRRGVKISIDDFGTGYSSLSVLRHLPVDFLKIDRSFTRELTADTSTASIIKLIVDIGHSINLEVICEGIENQEEMDFLLQYGCRLGQGFYFHRPASADEIGSLLSSKDSQGKIAN
ncbi:bifunctional diguanylate cyclase/phosphodiesterase [Paenibacillus sp. NEAU-GSW1]|uniref:putative bifunctional diguanylate cyclase/phosphodiesterase n=1 Tax=Paenibacillus sp. NEAU-GSW1 TaxID=2682486 RepID=UPI001C12C18E|nr:EAL domain-containing protein [Paenibacillus sp. NEAU-GSW1]